jgi:hypothetical protein
MAARIQIRRDFANNWTTNNPILTEGELGYELDTGKLKVGDGVKVWNTLNYFQETVNYTDVVDPPTNLSYFNNDVGYLTPDTPAGSITTGLINNWNTSFSWGNHAVAGYLTTSLASSTYLTIANAANNYQPLDADLTSIAALTGTTGLLRKTAANTWQLDTTNYLTTADAAGNVNEQDLTNWNLAYSWGDHSVAGYLTTSLAQITYQPLDSDLSSIAGLTGTTGLLRKTAANTWELDTTNYLSTVDASNTYLTQVNASSTYLTQVNATSIYLTQTNAASTYLTQANATSTYLTQSSAASTYLTQTNAANNYQPLDGDLTSIAGLAGTTGLLRKTAANTWQLDTSSYLTANQSITISGDATGTGSTAITLSLANSGVTEGTYRSVTVDIKGRVTGGSNPTTLSGYGITDAQPLDGDLTSIAGLAGTTGLLRKTATNTWELDTNSYLTSYTETDPTVGSHIKAITITDISNWNSSARIGSVPATPTSTGTEGTIAYTSDFLYVCIATNTWRRVALESWT